LHGKANVESNPKKAFGSNRSSGEPDTVVVGGVVFLRGKNRGFDNPHKSGER
jgi:hypothetical protein